MDTRRLFLVVAAATRPLLADPAVAAAWDRPSALEQLTVGALAGHLGRAIATTVDYLGAAPPPPGALRLDPAGYFLSIEGLGGEMVDLDSSLHRHIRRRSEEAAAGGHTAVLGRWDEAVVELDEALTGPPADHELAVLDGRAMRLDDYLVTRVIELVVHADDLAASIDRSPPPVPEAATGLVITTLVGVARRSHGDLAVVRALTRRERDHVAALRVL